MINIKRLFIVASLVAFFCVTNAFSQRINQLDTNGKRTGVWEKKYPSGKLRYTGTFLAGKEVGVFKFYLNASSRIPNIVKEFSKVSDSAFVKFYNSLGKLKTEGAMIGKNREGAWKYYFSNGKIFSEEFYSNGKLEGLLKNYYSNGSVTEETQYKNGLKNGVSKIYTESGILIEEVLYVDGKLDGEGKYFDLKGVIKEKGMYKDNKRVGKWEFYMDGEVTDKPKRKTHSVPKSN